MDEQRTCAAPERQGHEYTCEECGGRFYRYPSESQSANRYCSRQCYNQKRSRRNIERECGQCGQAFIIHASQAEHVRAPGGQSGVYCSRTCKAVASGAKRRTAVPIPCIICGKPVERTPSQLKQCAHTYCSNRCSAQSVHRAPTTGPYKGGFRDDLGHFVRSSWEANVCRVLKFLHTPYDYECRSFDLGGTFYRPDIWVGYWIEVKGEMKPDAAAKIEAFRWLYPNEALVVLDVSLYRQIEREFTDRIPEWERSYVPARLRGGDRRRKDVRGRLDRNRQLGSPSPVVPDELGDPDHGDNDPDPQKYPRHA